MKLKLLIAALIFTIPFCFSQTEKTIKGKVSCENLPLKGIEILNVSSKKTAITNKNGDFSILAKVRDTIMFISKDYQYERLILDKEEFEKKKLVISLIQKPEQLEEVVVISKATFPEIKFDKNIASQLNIEKAAKNPKPVGVYDGTIENGMGLNINLSNNRKKNDQIDFKELMKKNYDANFYSEILKIKPEDLGLFMEFCDADPKSKKVIENTNPLKLLDFLLVKHLEFKKLVASEKK